ncbi:MAG TPA: AAA family ATPase [Trebonia sp.]|jgi:exonuclease SbcC|nr:AAA family ATPase [Trebonia sp.]
MRPHRLRVTAFGAFAGTEEVRFDDLEGLFLLHGETGAGKTTLLDAIAFALYGRVPGERGKAKRLRSDHAATGVTTEVELEATIGGRRLRITRSPEQERPKRSGSGMTKMHTAVRLEEATASGEWEVKSIRVGEADAEILDLMGMSADQFFQVVLLPQGQFAQFLHAGAEARAELLQKLFGTDRFRTVERWLAERRRTTASEVEVADRHVSELMARVSQVAGEPLPDDPPDASFRGESAQGELFGGELLPDEPGMPGSWQTTWLVGLTSAAETRAVESAGLSAERKAVLDVALAAKGEAEQLASRQRRRAEALRKQGELEAAAPAIASLRAEADAAARAAEVAGVLDAADRAAKAAMEAGRAEERARSAIPAGHEAVRAAHADTLRVAEEEQRARLGRLDGLRAVAQQAADEERAVAAARERAAGLDAVLAAGETALTEHRRKRAESVAARDAASQAAEELPSAQEAAKSARQVADDATALTRQLATRQKLHEAHLTAREKALGLREDANRVREARIDGMRAELAAALVDGTPCPVCGSLDHPEPVEPTFEPVSREQEETAAALADKAAAEADKTGQRVAAADAVLSDLVQRLAAAGFTLPSGFPAGAPQTAVAVTPDPAALDATELTPAARTAETDAKRLEDEAGQLKAAAGRLSGLQRALDDLDKAIAEAERRKVESAEQRAAELEKAEGAAQRAAEAQRTLSAQLGDAPDLDTAVAATRRLADLLAATADAADTTARTAEEARDASDRAAAKAAEAGFSADSGAEPGAGDAGTTAIAAARAAFRTPKWRKEAAERIQRHETDTETVASLLADPELDLPLDPPAPVAAKAAAADEAQRDHAAAVEAHGKSAHTAEQLRSLKPQVTDALTALEPLKERADQARQLADLAGGLGANRYKMTLSSFVLAARLEEVAAAASQRLVTMTAGRYTLVHTDARKGGGRAGLGLLACDAWTGQDRDTSTLSGGETFLASLALALGLADVVTAEAAGTPMEALFVDEGFGTLDEETLEEVMTVLDGLREGGRIVGIVSHVSELRQRVPAQIHVRKGHHGSHVSVAANV